MILALAGCAGPPSAPPNVLLVTLDTTRADRLGCYGHAGAATPAIDALAASGVRFEHASTQAPLTLPAHAALLTGTQPRANGVRVNAGAGLPDDLPTLAERLRARGYRTAAFVSAFVLDAVFGLDRGFDLYDDEMGGRDRSERFEVERSADRVADAALAWLAQAGSEPFFAWVHFYDPHSPYAAPAEFARRSGDPYDAEIAFVDSQLARIVAWIDAAGLSRRTLVVVVGDHGEAFGEHGETEHGLFVYDTTVRVPLILSWPGRIPSGEVATERAQLVDVFPTILELTGDEAVAAIHGASLVPALRGETLPPRTLYGESRYGQIGYGWAPLRFVVDGHRKYVEAPRPELYDLADDPDELRDLAPSRPEEARRLRERLLEIEASIESRRLEELGLDAEARARLESLGYVGGTSPPPTEDEASASLRDPKEMADVVREHFHAVGLVGAGHFAEAAEILQRLVSRSPESADLYQDLGWAYLGLGRPGDAEQAYLRSLSNLPDHAERLWGLAEAQRRQGRYSEAIHGFQRALERRPSFGEAHMGLALCHAALEDYDAAYPHALRHAEINPGARIAWTNVINLAMGLGRGDEAVRAADRLVALDPDDLQARLLRERVLEALGRRGE